MPQQPVRIIGAGIGGLTLGRCLLKHGVPAVLYERMPSTPRHSYGVTLHASSYMPLLDILGLDEFTFRRRIAVDGSLGGNGNIESKSMVYPGKLISTSIRANREKLEKLLREGLDVQWEYTLEKVEQPPLGAALYFQNGQRLESSCVVGADGPHSNTRKSLSPGTPFGILPYVAFNGKRRVKRAVFDSIYAPAFKDSNADVVSVSWIFSRPSRGSTDPLHKPNRPVSEATDIPEEFFDEVAALDGLSQPFKEVFDAEKLGMERVLHWLMRTVLVKQQELQALAKKGLVFMGDSVHAEPILGGEGANNAITDGIELARCISSSCPSGILSWYESRYPVWERGIRKSENAITAMHNTQKAVLYDIL
ncbi:tyrosinase [Trichoderma asperellum]